MAAAKDRVSTIKSRHIQTTSTVESDAQTEETTSAEEVEEDVLEGQISGSALTPLALRRMAKSLSLIHI